MSTVPNPPDNAQPPAHKGNSSTTPVRKNLQSSQRFTSASKLDAEVLKVDMAQELAGQWVGPMPVKDFIETFLTLDDDILAEMPNFQTKSKHFNSLAKEEHEPLMYDPFIEAVEASGALRNQYKLVNTSDHADRDAITSMKNKPDVSCFQIGHELGSNISNFEEIELVLEFKPYKNPADPFDDEKKPGEGVVLPFEPKSNAEDVHGLREKCRGQLACYTRVWSARQHRTHCFLLWLGDPHARIIRMDRSGGIVSRKFNYRTEEHHLLEFLWRFSHATPEARGRDTTVSKASEEESEKAIELLKAARFIPSRPKTVFKIQIPAPDEEDQDKTTMRPFLVWGPLADPHSPTGRATRGYPAVDLKGNNGDGAIVFLKDSWRSIEEGMEKESAILRDLNKELCQNVPKLICGDDLDGQLTLTKTYAEMDWNIGARPEDIIARIHTRFTQEQVGYHLESFRSSKEFLEAVFHAFLAHKDAWEKCGILHRDISAGNILMRRNGYGGGFLNDWDLAKRINKDLVARQPFRSGTWQFMSVALLDKPDKVISLQDDMESFLWLVLYHILRYTNHNRPQNLRSVMKRIFDEEHNDDAGQRTRGGSGKKEILDTSRGSLNVDFAILGNKPLTLWIFTMLNHWEQWYDFVRSNVRAVAHAVQFLEMSLEDAIQLHPFDDSTSVMRNHDEMLSVFQHVLKMESWPKSDLAFDALSPPPQVKRGQSEVIAEHNSNTTLSTAGAKPAEGAAPPKKRAAIQTTSKRLEDPEGSYSLSLTRLRGMVGSSIETRPNRKPVGTYAEEDPASD